MIYEKREAGVEVKREDMPVKDVRSQSLVPTQKSTALPSLGHITKRRMRLARKKHLHSARHGGRKKVLAASVLVLCIFVLDAGVLGGRLKAELGGAVRSGARYTLENLAGEETQNINSLYTRLVSDGADNNYYHNETDGAAEYEAAVKTQGDEPQTVAAANNISQSFVDGTRFYPITSLDLSADSLYSLSNGTSFSPDMKKIAGVSPKALEDIAVTDEPLVLIVHTHGEECYTEYTDMYPQGEETRSTDTEKNVVRVGKEIADTLADFGVNAIHCTKMHDSESFINAYTGSASSVKKYLEEYPSIKIVVDVHRDAIIREDGESVKAVANIAGEDYAQIMFVVGTNELGHNHPDWQDNLSLALSLQKSISDTYPSLCRSINLRNVPFNQQLSSGYLLLEVGTCANTLDEALRSARAFGENLARTVVSAQD